MVWYLFGYVTMSRAGTHSISPPQTDHHDKAALQRRRVIQELFIAPPCVAAVTGCIAFAMMAYHMPRSTRLALCGLIVLTAFVLIRAASLRRVSILLNTRAIGLKVSWILEIGDILLMLLASRLRLGTPK